MNTMKGITKIDMIVDNGGTVETKTFVVNQKCFDRLFDKTCVGWTSDSKFNLCYLQHNQRYAKDMLRANGILYLNDVYRILCLPTTAIGQMYGWTRDSVVDFGVDDICNEEFRKGNVTECYLSFKNLEFILGK